MEGNGAGAEAHRQTELARLKEWERLAELEQIKQWCREHDVAEDEVDVAAAALTALFEITALEAVLADPGGE